MLYYLELQIQIKHVYLTLSMIECLKRANALLVKVYKWVKKVSDIKNFESVSFKYFTEAKEELVEIKKNHIFLNKYLISNHKSDHN